MSDAELARRRRNLDAAVHEKVDFQGTSARPTILSGRTEVQLSHLTWASQGNGPWHQERLDAAVRGAPVGAGFALYADMSARRWTSRPGPVSFRPDDAWQVYVWEAELVRRPSEGGLALALGRIRPWVAQGATIIDGAQAGFRTKGNVEYGVFAGAVPDPSTLSPSSDRSTFGGYLAHQVLGEAGALVQYTREELRVAYANSPEFGRRVEAEGLAQISLGRRLDLAGQARVSHSDSGSALDSASADVGFRPIEALSVIGGFRYQGSLYPELDGPGTILLGGAGRHADLTARWEFAPWLTLAATSGLAQDLTTGVSRKFIGPEVGLPRLFGEVGGASAGYLQEGGWSSGHSAWAQVLTRRPRGIQTMLRVYWYQTRSLGPFTEDELGAYLSVSTQLNEFVALRLSALGRAGGVPGIRPFSSAGSLLGGTLDASLAGRF